METIGSVMIWHRKRGRCSVRADSLSTEVWVTWNGPKEFQPQTRLTILEAVSYTHLTLPTIYSV